jgi:hypothetical protein
MRSQARSNSDGRQNPGAEVLPLVSSEARSCVTCRTDQVTPRTASKAPAEHLVERQSLLCDLGTVSYCSIIMRSPCATRCGATCQSAALRAKKYRGCDSTAAVSKLEGKPGRGLVLLCLMKVKILAKKRRKRTWQKYSIINFVHGQYRSCLGHLWPCGRKGTPRD